MVHVEKRGDPQFIITLSLLEATRLQECLGALPNEDYPELDDLFDALDAELGFDDPDMEDD